jgi:hypothetical protein
MIAKGLSIGFKGVMRSRYDIIKSSFIPTPTSVYCGTALGLSPMYDLKTLQVWLIESQLIPPIRHSVWAYHPRQTIRGQSLRDHPAPFLSVSQNPDHSHLFHMIRSRGTGSKVSKTRGGYFRLTFSPSLSLGFAHSKW